MRSILLALVLVCMLSAATLTFAQETTTVAEGETTTAAEGETTTAAEGETTTAAEGEMTTAAPCTDCPPEITILTKDVSAIPLNIEIVAMVKDYNPDETVGTWSCAAASGSDCPSNLTAALSANGTNSGVFIAGPIPAGHYTLWMTYKSVRSANVSLTVLCNASELTSANKCPGRCVYDCPDATCANNLASCSCTVHAQISGAEVSVWPAATTSGQLLSSIELEFSGTASYRQANGSCSAFDFAPYMTRQWRVYAGTNTTAMTLASTIVANATKLSLPAKFFTPNQAYTVTVSFYDLSGTMQTSKSYTFTAKAPVPVVSVTTKGTKIVVGPRAIRLTAVVTDAYLSGTGTWSCTTSSEGGCPESLTSALSANGTNTGVYIEGPVTAGTYSLVLTYKEVASDALTLEVMSTEVPRVSIISSVVPLIQPRTYLFTQSIAFAAAVRYANSTTTLKWFVNDVEFGTNSTLKIPTYRLTQSTESAEVVNTITLRATSTANTSLFGETTTRVVIAPNQTVTLNTVSNQNNATHPLLPLTDVAVLAYASAGAIGGMTLSYEAGYTRGSGDSKTKVVLARTSSLSASFVAPLPSPVTATSLEFYVDLFVNGRFAASSVKTYEVRSVDVSSAKASQQAGLTSSDPQVKQASILALVSLLGEGNTTDDAALKRSMLASMKELAKSGSVDGATMLSMLGGVVGKSTEGGKVTDATVQSETVATLKDVAGKVTQSTAGAALTILNQLELNKDVADVLQEMASALSKNVEVGETVQSTSGDVSISGSKQLGATIAGSKSKTAGASLEVTTPFKDVDPEDVLSIQGSTTKGKDPFGKCKGDHCSTVSYVIERNGAPFPVSGLTDVMYVDMESTDGARAVCQYYDLSTDAWSTAGTWLVSYTATSIRCASTHLTTFAGFAGSSSAGSTVVASLAALVAIALAQLLAQ